MNEAFKFYTVIQIKVPRYILEANGSAGSGTKSVRAGDTVADIHITMDAALLAQFLGPKAMRNKSRITRIQAGAVTLEAKNISRTVK